MITKRDKYIIYLTLLLAVVACGIVAFAAMVIPAAATNHTADDSTNQTQGNATTETFKQVTNTLDIVSVDRWGEDSVTFTVRNEKFTGETIVVTEFTDDEYVTTTYNVAEGEEQITYEFKLESQEKLYVGTAERGVAIRGSQSVFRELLDDATEYMIPHGAIGGGAGTLSAVVLWYIRKSRKEKSRFVDYVTKQKFPVPEPNEREEEDDEPDGRLAQLRNELAKTRVRLVLLAIGLIGIQQYYGITPDDVPVWAYVVVFSALSVGFAAYIVWPKINAWLGLYEIPRDLIADIGNFDHYHEAELRDGIEPVQSVNNHLPVKLYKVHPETAAEIDIRGQERTWSISSGTLRVVSGFDPTEMEAEAADISEVPEYELVAMAEAVEERKARANKFVSFGKRVHRSLTTLLEKVEAAHHMNLNESEREKMLYDAESVEDDLRSEFPELEELRSEGKSVTDEYEQLTYSDETAYEDADKAGGDDE